MKTYYVFLLLTLIYSCSLFKRTTKTSNETNQSTDEEMKMTRKTDLESNKQSRYLTYHSDSINSAYRFFLWPKGKVRFNPGGGIEGNFDSVLVTGNFQELAKSANNIKVYEQQKLQSKIDLMKEAKSKAKEKNSLVRSFPDVILIIGILLLFVVCGFWLVKRLKV